MKIPTGNFGNLTVQPQPTRVNVGNVGAVGKAVQGVANSVNHLAQEQQQENFQLARARAGSSLVDYEMQTKDVAESIRQQLQDGTLRSDMAGKAYTEAIAKLEKPKVDGLDEVGLETFSKGLTRLDNSGVSTVAVYVNSARRVEMKNSVDDMLDNWGKLTNYPGANVAKINAQVASLDEQGRVAYGAEWVRVKQNFQDKNWFNEAQQRLMTARNNGGALSALNNDLTSEKGFYLDKLDPEKRNALLNQSMSYQVTLENRAQVAAARREAKAGRAFSDFERQVSMDLPTTAEQQVNLINATKGTIVEADVKDLLANQVKIREVISQGPLIAQNYVNELSANLTTNGGDMKQWRNLQLLNTAVQKSNKQLMDSPLTFNQNRTGEAVQPLDMMAVSPTLSAVGSAMEGKDITDRFAEQIASRSATLDALSQNTGFKVPHKILLPQEAAALTSALKDKPTGEQVAVLAQLRKTIPDDRDYKAVMQQIYPEAPAAALAGSLSDQKSTNKVLQGYEQLKTDKGDMSNWNAAKKDFVTEFDNVTGNAFAGRPEARQGAINIAFAYHVGNASQKGEYSTDISGSQVKDAIKNTVGESTSLGGAQVFVPVGVSVSDFKYRYPAVLYKALERQGMDVSRANQASLFNLLPAGPDGDYFVVQGRDALVDAKGRPLTINLSKSTIDGINNAEAAVINTKIKDYSIYGYSKADEANTILGAE